MYKRQAISVAILVLAATVGVRTAAVAVAVFIRRIITEPDIGHTVFRHIPVSYTHLDVYKRQGEDMEKDRLIRFLLLLIVLGKTFRQPLIAFGVEGYICLLYTSRCV